MKLVINLAFLTQRRNWQGKNTVFNRFQRGKPYFATCESKALYHHCSLPRAPHICVAMNHARRCPNLQRFATIAMKHISNYTQT
jgi:hypothetical protein